MGRTTAPVGPQDDRRAAAWLAWGVLGLTGGLLVLVTIPALGGTAGWTSLGSIPVSIGFALVGALVAARTSNRVGWLFLAEGFAVAYSSFSHNYMARTPQLPAAAWIGWTLEPGAHHGLPCIDAGAAVVP